MVRHHPTVGQIYGFVELHRNDLGIHLYDNAFQPAAHAVSLLIFVVAIHFHAVSNAIDILTVGSGGKP
jgi:hypothetical protein